MLSCLDPSAAFEQQAQETEFGGGEIDGISKHHDLVPFDIHLDPLTLEPLDPWIVSFVHASEHGLNPQHEFLRAERLADVVVAACFEALDAVCLLRLCCQENDRHLFEDWVGAEKSTDLDAAQFGHHDVENDQIRDEGPRHSQALDRVVQRLDEEALGLEVIGHQGGDIRFIIDDKDLLLFRLRHVAVTKRPGHLRLGESGVVAEMSQTAFGLSPAFWTGGLGTMSPTLRILYMVSFASLIVSVAVHISTFFGYAYYPVLLFVFLLFIVWPCIVWQWRRMPRSNLSSQVFGNIPRWMKITTVGLFVYVFVNYFVCRALNSGGQPVLLSDGRYVLQAGQQVLRVLDSSEYAWAQAYQIRMLSGHLLVFYGLAVLAIKALWIKTGPAMASAKVTGH